jgi:hypothetical protein
LPTSIRLRAARVSCINGIEPALPGGTTPHADQYHLMAQGAMRGPPPERCQFITLRATARRPSHETSRCRAVLSGIHPILKETRIFIRNWLGALVGEKSGVTNERRQMRALRDSECSGSDSQMQRF